MQKARLLGLALTAGLLLTGCVTKYVIISGVPKSELRVVVFTDNSYSGALLLEELEGRGFENYENELMPDPNDEFNIKWGAAPTVYIEEIAALVERNHDVKLSRLHEFESDDYDVFINLPVDPDELPDRDAFEVTVFTDDEDNGVDIMGMIEDLGYTNDGNDILGEDPGYEYNIKWGGAPEAYIDEISELIEEEYDIDLNHYQSFDSDDHDIYIALPFNSPDLSERIAYEVTVFCDDEEKGGEILNLLAGLGYVNEDNEVLGGPNDEFNIKYGALIDKLLEEIATALDDEFGMDFERLDCFESDDRDVFINIPGQ